MTYQKVLRKSRTLTVLVNVFMVMEVVVISEVTEDTEAVDVVFHVVKGDLYV